MCQLRYLMSIGWSQRNTATNILCVLKTDQPCNGMMHILGPNATDQFGDDDRALVLVPVNAARHDNHRAFAVPDRRRGIRDHAPRVVIRRMRWFSLHDRYWGVMQGKSRQSLLPSRPVQVR